MLNLFGLKEEAAVDLLRKRGCTMAFQPIIENSTGKISGFEALLRGFDGRPIPNPEELFSQKGSLSEDQLLRLDIACIGDALCSGRALTSRHHIFINILAVTLEELSRNADTFSRLLRYLGIEPNHIVFEISEKTDDACVGDIAVNLRTFLEMGIQTAIDDAGSSLTWLHHMLVIKPSFLKIDKSLIGKIDADGEKQAAVQSLARMAKTLGLRLIAEGIERPQELQAVDRIGVPLVQGFWLGYPQAAEKWRHVLDGSDAPHRISPINELILGTGGYGKDTS